MGIIEELQKREIKINETKCFYGGYYHTPKGVKIVKKANYESNCEKSVHFLELITKGKEKGKLIPYMTKVYFVQGTEYEDSNLTTEEADKLVAEGKIYGFVAIDLYREYYNMESDPELECCMKHRYSRTSEKYIHEVMREIGMCDWTEAEYGDNSIPTKFDVIKIYPTPTLEEEDTDIGQLNDKTWIAQTGYAYGIDGYCLIKMYFDHLPTERDLEVAFTIRAFSNSSIELYRKRGTDTWIHWLDMEGDIVEKYKKMKELIDYDCDNWEWK